MRAHESGHNRCLAFRAQAGASCAPAHLYGSPLSQRRIQGCRASWTAAGRAAGSLVSAARRKSRASGARPLGGWSRSAHSTNALLSALSGVCGGAACRTGCVRNPSRTPPPLARAPCVLLLRQQCPTRCKAFAIPPWPPPCPAPHLKRHAAAQQLVHQAADLPHVHLFVVVVAPLPYWRRIARTPLPPLRALSARAPRWPLAAAASALPACR